MRTYFTIQDSKDVRNAIMRIKKILDANYKNVYLKKIFNNLKYLSNDKQSFILKLSKKRKKMFDSSLGNYVRSKYKIDLLEGANSNHAKLSPIPKIYEETLKTEVNRLIKISVLKLKNNFK